MKRLARTSAKQVKELRTFLQETKNIHERERARAILKCIEGQQRQLIARVFDIHIKTLDSWISKFNRCGITGIKGQGQSGNHHLLSREEKQKLRQLLFVEKKTPRELGYEGRFWTTETLACFLKDRYGVAYQARTSYQRLFTFIGFTSHKPIKVNKKRNEEARRRFVEMVKKNLSRTKEKTALSW